LYSGILFVVASVFCAMAENIVMMNIARFFQGMVVCAVIVAGYASIHELYESKQAVKTLAWMGGVAILAPALGPLFGGILLLFGSWRWLFIILAIWGAILILMLKRWMPESLPPEKRSKFNLSKVFRDNQQFVINMGTFCLLFAGAIVWMAIGPLLVIRDFHLTPVWYGIIQIFVLGSYIGGTVAIRLLIRYRGLEGTLKIALPIALTGTIISVCCAYIWPNQLLYIVISLMIFQFGCGLSLAPLNRLSIESTEQPMGIRVALFSFLMGWAAVMGIVSASLFHNDTLHSFAWLILFFTLSATLLKSIHFLKNSHH
jgi:MFS family permease